MNEKTISLKKSALRGSVTLPASKSMAHRYLIASALSGNQTIIYGTPNSVDIKATIDGLTALGASFLQEEKGGLKVIPIPLNNTASATVNCKESGTTLRLLLPIAAALGRTVRFIGEGRLPQRPIGELIDSLVKMGAKCDGRALPVTVSGNLHNTEIAIDASISSQYASGLLFAMPLAQGEGLLKLEGKIVSGGYIDLTLDVLREFGLKIKQIRSKYAVCGGQTFRSPGCVNLEGDWSSACFWAVAGVLNGDLEIGGLKGESKQGDSVICELLQRAGANVKYENGVLYAQKSKLHAVDFCCKDCPDIVPAMSVALACAEGASHITGVSRLRSKESDRLAAVLAMLNSFGVDAQYFEDTLTIIGGGLVGGKIEAFNDHRIAMSALVAGTCADGVTEVEGIDCIAKSYPDFVNEFVRLGGRIL